LETGPTFLLFSGVVHRASLAALTPLVVPGGWGVVDCVGPKNTRRCGAVTSPVRKEFVDALEKAGIVDQCTSNIPLGKWHDVLASYAFVLSPRGVGYDCFRHWQVLSAGSIPIIPIEDAFDMRMFDGTNAWLVRTPADVIRQFKERLPEAMKPLASAELPDTLSLVAWNARFRSVFNGTARR
jgi:hypothetical protein